MSRVRTVAALLGYAALWVAVGFAATALSLHVLVLGGTP